MTDKTNIKTICGENKFAMVSESQRAEAKASS